MKRHKSKHNQVFNVNDHRIDVELTSQCVTSNPQERSYRKKQCKIVFLDAVKDSGKEYIQIYFSNMRSAAVFIANHIDSESMRLNVFGNQYLANMMMLICNYKIYAIYEIDGESTWKNIIANEEYSHKK